MSLLIISFLVNGLVLIVSAQEDASLSVVSAPAASSSWSSYNDFKPRMVPKVWNDCGTACPLTCAQPKQRPCVFICKADWFCPKDYYENSFGQCVLLEDCESGSTTPQPPQHLPGHIVGRPRPRPRPFYPGFPPVPFPRPLPANYTHIPNDLNRFPEFPKIELPMGPPQPRPIFQIDPVRYNATAVANGAPTSPPAVVRTSGSNVPSFGFSMVPKSKPLIDLDPTVPRPVLRVSQEQSSDK